MSATLAHRASPPEFATDSASNAYRVWQFVTASLQEGVTTLLSLSVTSDGMTTRATRASSATLTTAATGGSNGAPNHGPMDASLTPEQQLEALVREHLDSVYRVAYSVVRDNALAEDVAQDAILKAWNALPTFRGDSSLRSWLLRITHNTAISTLRRRREEIRDPDLLPERTSGTSTEKQVLDRITRTDFEEALGQLDELSRSIVVLREVEGLSYDEISDMLEVPLPTVKTRLLRARRVLAAALADWRA